MKVLIVGKNSYIGQCVGNWFCQKDNPPEVNYISVRDNGWREYDLSAYEVVIFAAAIVHQKDLDDWALYQRVNALLPQEFAEQAKKQGVKQFIYISTAGVYQSEKSLPIGTVIDKDTLLSPSGMYGKSKLEGENRIKILADDFFYVSIIRPMNVYGYGCRGNYIPLFIKLTKSLAVLPCAFPDVKQGMVYIDNLAELCWLVANSNQSGIYMAQDMHPVSTVEIVSAIALAQGKKKPLLKCTWFFQPLCRMGLVKKLFGGIAYTDALALCPLGNYQIVDFAEGIRRTVCGVALEE